MAEKSKVLMAISVVEEPGEHIHVVLGLQDPHLQRCPSCLATYAVRICAAINDAIEDMRAEDSADQPAAAGGAVGQHNVH